MPTIVVGGGDIFIDGRNVGSSYESPGPVNGQIVALPPPSGQSFLGWEGDTSALSDPNAELTDFAMGSTNLTITANTSDSPVNIDDTSFATLDAKLDAIYVDTQAMRAGTA